MAYIIGGRSLFVHVPKTGGKWILAAVRRAGLRARPVRSPGYHVGHAGISKLADRRYRIPPFSFLIARETVDWWESLWRFSESPGSKLYDIDPAIGHPFRPILEHCRPGLSCDDFVRRIVEAVPGFYGAMLREYLDDGIEFVGRFDDLAGSLLAALRTAGVPIRKHQAIRIRSTSPVNVSKPSRRERLSDVVRDLVTTSEPEAGRLLSSIGVNTTTKTGAKE